MTKCAFKHVAIAHEYVQHNKLFSALFSSFFPAFELSSSIIANIVVRTSEFFTFHKCGNKEKRLRKGNSVEFFSAMPERILHGGGEGNLSMLTSSSALGKPRMTFIYENVVFHFLSDWRDVWYFVRFSAGFQSCEWMTHGNFSVMKILSARKFTAWCRTVGACNSTFLLLYVRLNYVNNFYRFLIARAEASINKLLNKFKWPLRLQCFPIWKLVRLATHASPAANAECIRWERTLSCIWIRLNCNLFDQDKETLLSIINDESEAIEMRTYKQANWQWEGIKYGAELKVPKMPG